MKRILFLISIIAFIITEIFIVKASADLSGGLIAHYPFNSNARDKSGNGRDGTVFGATLTEDRFGNPNSSYHFDGADDYIKVTIPMNGDTEWSICCWINIENFNYPYTDFQDIISNYQDNFAIGFYTIDRSLSIWDEGAPRIRSNPNTVTQDTNIFICFVKSYNILKIYKNGQLIISNEYGNVVGFSELKTIGMWNEHSSDPFQKEPFNGDLDEIRIYDRVLSENEIQQLFNGSIAIAIPEDATEGEGFLEDQGIVSVFSVPNTDLVINLSSDNTSLVEVPETVTIYADQNSATFVINILDNCIVNGSQTVTIKASASGYISGSDTIQVADNDVSVEMNLASGWNLISLPVMPCNASVSSLFPKAKIIYGYEKYAGYVQVEEIEDLEVGKGYWILLDQNQRYTHTGQPIQSYNQTVYEDGWEMIGGCTYLARTLANNCSIGVIYRYVQGIGYQRVLESEKLEPGKGYWILLRDSTAQAHLCWGLFMNYFYDLLYSELLNKLAYPVVTSYEEPIKWEIITSIAKDRDQLVSGDREYILTFTEMTFEQRNAYLDFLSESSIIIAKAREINENNNELLFFRNDIIGKNYESEWMGNIISSQLGEQWKYPEFDYTEYRSRQWGRTFIKPSMTLKTGKQMTLKKGLYFFEELTLEKNSTLNTEGDVLIYVAKLELKENAKLMGGTSIYPDSAKPNDLIILAGGWPGLASTSQIKIGPTAKICGHIFAPNSKVCLSRGSGGKATMVYGSILTRQLITYAPPGHQYGPIWIIYDDYHIFNLPCELTAIPILGK